MFLFEDVILYYVCLKSMIKKKHDESGLI